MRVLGDDHQVVEGRPEAGAAPVDLRDVAAQAAFQLNVVPRPHDFARGQVRAGEEVAQGGLERQGHGEAADAEARNEGADLDAELVEDEQPGGDVDHHRDDALQGRDDPGRKVLLAVGGRVGGVPVDDLVDDAGYDHCCEDDHQDAPRRGDPVAPGVERGDDGGGDEQPLDEDDEVNGHSDGGDEPPSELVFPVAGEDVGHDGEDQVHEGVQDHEQEENAKGVDALLEVCAEIQTRRR